MRRKGNTEQWVGYPTEVDFWEDVVARSAYLLTDGDRPLATFALTLSPDPHYAHIEQGRWIDTLTPYLTLHRMAKAPGAEGVAKHIFRYAKSRCGHLRLDTHESNLAMRKLARRQGFVHCGIVYMDDHTPRLAYEWWSWREVNAGLQRYVVHHILPLYDGFDPAHRRDHALRVIGRAMAIRILDHVRERMVEFQEETGHMYNLEATPAEGTTYRFAREDRKHCPGIIQAGTQAEPYYTNSSQLPVGYTTDPFQALGEQEELQKKYTGGTVLHLYMGERVSNSEACKQLVKRSLENFRLPYITVTPTFSICPKHGYIAGEHAYCPICDEELALAKRRRIGA